SSQCVANTLRASMSVPARPGLPVIKTVDAVYSYFFGNLPAFAATAGLLILATLVVRVGLAWMALEAHVLSAFVAAGISICFSWLAASTFAVLWHTRILVPGGADLRKTELSHLLVY